MQEICGAAETQPRIKAETSIQGLDKIILNCPISYISYTSGECIDILYPDREKVDR